MFPEKWSVIDIILVIMDRSLLFSGVMDPENQNFE